MSARTGESVSTSEIAKQLLESAREDRLEVVDMLVNPTDALVQIRRKGEAQHVSTRANGSLLLTSSSRVSKLFPAEHQILSRASHLVMSLTPSLPYELRPDQRASKHDEYYWAIFHANAAPESEEF